MRSGGSLLSLVALLSTSPLAAADFVVGAEYTQIGLGAATAHTGVTWAKTRNEAFSWGAVEPSPPIDGRHTYDFGCTDDLVREHQQAGIVNLQSYLDSKSSWGSTSSSDIMPKPSRMEDYRAFVSALVERYDGDGRNDMPGLVAPILIWVVGAEWTGFWPSGNADDYLRLLEVSAQAIRAADPNAKIGLIPFMLVDVFEGNRPTDQQIADRLKDPPPVIRKSTAGMLKMLDRPELFDFVDIHSLGDYTELPPTIAWFRARMKERGYDRPVFIDDAYPASYLANFGWPAIYPVTQANYGRIFRLLADVSDYEEPEYSTALRWVRGVIASSLVKKVVVAAAEGYAGIQIGNTEDWMSDPGKPDRGVFVAALGAVAMSGLIDTFHPLGLDTCTPRVSGGPRPGWQSLRLAASLVSGFDRIDPVPGLPAGIWAYRIQKGGRSSTILWYESRTLPLPGEPAPSVLVNLPVSGASSVNVVTSVPESGWREPSVATLPVVSGAVRLTVGRTPLVVEPVDGTARTTLHVPIVLSAPGLAGSTFSSELTLANRGTTDASLRLVYTPAYGSGGGTVPDVLAAGRQRVLPDAIAYLRSKGLAIPSSGTQGGTLAVTFSGLSSTDAAAVSVRTTTPTADGRAGLAYGGVADALRLDTPVYLWGLRQDARDRSNVAILNAGERPITLRLTVLSANPAAPSFRVLPDETLAGGELRQITGILSSSGLSLPSGAVRVERVAGSDPFGAYAVLNDQVTSDGSFVPPWPMIGWSRRLVLPAVVETSSFSTEVVLGNPASTTRKIRLTYVADAVTAAGAAASLDVDLRPLEQVVIPSFVQLLRDRGVAGIGPRGPTFAGALFVGPADGQPLEGLFVGGRTTTPRGAGRYGLFYTALPEEMAANRSAWLFGLLQDGENRSNVAIVNLGESDSAFDVDVFDGTTGALAGSLSGIRLGARRWTQIGTVLAAAAAGVRSGYARVVQVSGANPFLAYAVVNDGARPEDRSGDGAFVEMVPGE